MGKNGFTLTEMIVSMAVYSILLVIVGYAVTTFSKLNSVLINNNEYDEAVIMENFIVDTWNKNNGSITLNEQSLMSVNGKEMTFDKGTLYFDGEIVSGHEYINSVERTINDDIVVFIITIQNNNIKEIRIILYISGGNSK